MQLKTSQRTKIFIKNWYHGNFWKVHRSLSRCLKSEKKPGYLNAKLSNLANIYWSSYKPTQNKLRKHGILKKPIIIKDIVIVTPNKWNDVVFLDGNICHQKLMILQSLRKRKIMPLKLEKNNNSVFWVKSRKKIFLIKICKILRNFFDSADFSLRPNISSISNYNYNVAKFLTELLDPVILKRHCAKDLFSFCEET